MNVAERQKLLDDMDNAAYECAGGLWGILALHEKGTIELPPLTAIRTRRLVNRLTDLQAAFYAEDAMMKAAGK